MFWCLVNGLPEKWVLTLGFRFGGRISSSVPSRSPRALSPKLPEMVVQMLIHQRRPFYRSQRAEKEVRMPCACSRPTRCKAVNEFAEPLPLHSEVPFITHHQALVRPHIPRHGLLFRDHRLLRKAPQQPPNEYAWRFLCPHRHLHCRGAMRQSLRWIHFAPHPARYPASAELAALLPLPPSALQRDFSYVGSLPDTSPSTTNEPISLVDGNSRCARRETKIITSTTAIRPCNATVLYGLAVHEQRIAATWNGLE